MYKQVLKDSDSLNECRDCAVRAVAIVTNTPYKIVHNMMAKHGRKFRCGTDFSITIEVLRELGVYIEKTNLTAKTIKYLPEVLPKGRYLVRTYAHILPCINGKVLDWSEGRQHRPKEIYEISF